MSSHTENKPVTPALGIPSMVSIANGDDSDGDNKFEGVKGCCFPGTGIVASQFPGPLGLFTEPNYCKPHASNERPSSVLKHRHVKDDSPLSKASPTPCLVEENDSESDGDLWHRGNLQAPPPSIMLSPSYSAENNEYSSKKSGLEESADHRLVHKQTADGHYLLNSQPLGVSPMNGLKYNLTGGRKSMTREMRQASDVEALIKKTKPNSIISGQSPRNLLSRMDGTAFKIFLLLIQPKSKIFEIIQVFYSSSSSAKDVLDMIPTNATEPALGSQVYTGLCRPQDGKVLNLETTAKIARGEILVAIPEGYEGAACAKISKPILANPKVTRLLNKSDPLAPKRKNKKSNRSSNHRHRTIAIETVREETESVFSKLHTSIEEHEQSEQELLRLAMQHAAEEAASSNAAVEPSDYSSPGHGEADNASITDIPVELWKTTMSLQSRSVCSRSSSVGEGSTIASNDGGDASSFASSFASFDDFSKFKRIPRKTKKTIRRKSRTKQQQLYVRIAILVVGLMILRYWMVERTSVVMSSSPSMFGVFGGIQVILAFVALYKLQRYMQGTGHVNNCPFCNKLLSAWESRRIKKQKQS